MVTWRTFTIRKVLVLWPGATPDGCRNRTVTKGQTLPGSNYTEPELDRAALVVVDVQNDFASEGGAMIVEGTSTRVPTMASVIEAFRAAARPIVHVVRLYRPFSHDVELLRRASVEGGASIAAPGTHGSQIVRGLLPDAIELDHRALLAGETPGSWSERRCPLQAAVERLLSDTPAQPAFEGRRHDRGCAGMQLTELPSSDVVRCEQPRLSHRACERCDFAGNR